MKASQSNQILDYLKSGQKLTAMDALEKFGCFRLASRINDLRKSGEDIKTTMKHLRNGKTIAEYWIDLPKGQIPLGL